MTHAWVLDTRYSDPPEVAAHVEGDGEAFLSSISMLTQAFPEPGMVLVVDVNLAFVWKDGRFVQR